MVGQTKSEVVKLLKKKGLQSFREVVQYMLEGWQRGLRVRVEVPSAARPCATKPYRLL